MTAPAAVRDRRLLQWKRIVVGVCLAVGALHFVTGPGYRGPWPRFVHGYLIDLLLPFAMYLLLGVGWRGPAKRSGARAAAVFGIGATVELLQYLGVPVFGATFDVLDLVMYAAGVVAGVLVEAVAMSRFGTGGASAVGR